MHNLANTQNIRTFHSSKNYSESDYKKISEHINSLPTFSIVTGGRAGSDFLQSVFDSHPQVLTFNGWFPFHELFWNKSVCAAANSFALEDIIDELVGMLIYKFKTRYDIQEQKDRLGPHADSSIDIDIPEFKKHVLFLMKYQDCNSKNLLTAVTTAYRICLDEDMFFKKIVLHHTHLVEGIENHLSDFPASKLIYMVRDPRANIVSGYENFSKYYPSSASGELLVAYIRSILIDDISAIKQSGVEYRILRVEDLDRRSIYENLCQWMGIEYSETAMTSSTWAGLEWRGDRLSTNKVNGLSRDVLKNNWQSKLSYLDKYIISYLTIDMRKHYGYTEEEVLPNFIFSFFLIFKPLGYEIDLFFNRNNKNADKKKLKYVFFMYYYFLRVKKFLQVFMSPPSFTSKDIVISEH